MPSDSQEQLVAWVRSVSNAEISFAPPSASPGEGTGVNVYLLEVRGQLPLSPSRPDTRQLELAYLVTTWADDPAQAEQLLVDLCFAAMDRPGIEIEADPPDVTLWQALGLPPRPCFRVNVPLRRSRPEAALRRVLKPLVLEPAALISLAGVVRTPDNVPVPEARVEVAALDRRATTDRHGSFRLDGVPADGHPLQIHASARGREVVQELRENDDRSFVVITLDVTEAVHG